MLRRMIALDRRNPYPPTAPITQKHSRPVIGITDAIERVKKTH